MIGIGPFIPHKDTVFCKRNRRQSGSDFESGCHVAADESKRYDSGDNSGWHDRSERA